MVEKGIKELSANEIVQKINFLEKELDKKLSPQKMKEKEKEIDQLFEELGKWDIF